jgi:hypothetical protein
MDLTISGVFICTTLNLCIKMMIRVIYLHFQYWLLRKSLFLEKKKIPSTACLNLLPLMPRASYTLESSFVQSKPAYPNDILHNKYFSISTYIFWEKHFKDLLNFLFMSHITSLLFEDQWICTNLYPLFFLGIIPGKFCSI